ncbi:MAG: hypothetical protein LBK47_07425 [Prevotellaceae bacterium]|jgi:hypothetical protein|nr:hypothetical protein [Prevotellaceae bacterium]
MISAQIIKQPYLSRTLKEEAEWIGKEQQGVIKDWGLMRTGTLYGSLRGFFSYHPLASGGVLTLRYLTYLRFLDMKSRQKGRKNKYAGLHFILLKLENMYKQDTYK